jgi:hypothetical protein
MAALAVGGCGGSDDEGMSKEAFSQQANKGCANANKKAASEIEDAFKLPEFANAKSEAEGIRAEVTELVPILIKEAEAEHKSIQGLGSPDEGEAQVQSMLTAYSDWIKKAEASPLKIVIANDIFNNARELAKKYGLAKCGQTPFEVVS